MSIRRLIVCAAILLLCVNAASAARYQRCKDGKTMVWNSLRGVAQEAEWTGLRDPEGYATGQGTLVWYRLAGVVNSYTGKMVRGKFEGVVVKEQAGTSLQASFSNGEKTSDWSQPGEEESPTPSPAAKKRTPTPGPTETPVLEEENQESVTPKPTRTPKPSPTRTPTARPTPSATLTPTATPVPTPLQTPTPLPIHTPTPTATPTPIPNSTPAPISTPRPSAISTPPPVASVPPLKSEPSSMQSPSNLRLDRGFTAPTRDSLDLALPPPALRNALPPAPRISGISATPWNEPPSLASSGLQKSEDRRAQSAAPSSTSATAPLTGSKAKMISEFKKETIAAMAQAKSATNGFIEVKKLDDVQTLPPPVSGSVSALANQAHDLRAKLGYEVAMYECGAETATTEALVTLDQSTQDLLAKNAPAARLKLMNFFKRYSRPNRDDQVPLWRYVGSILDACMHARKNAETRLERAKSLESAGKMDEALREYEGIFRIYPNPITADKIRSLQPQTSPPQQTQPEQPQPQP